MKDELSREGDLEIRLENPNGFFESKRLVALNDQLLQILHSDWRHPPVHSPVWNLNCLEDKLSRWREDFSDYALNRNWIDKDPRLCITYSAYLHILFKRVPLVASLRNPIDVATSLYLRNGIDLDIGLAIWYLYNYHLAGCLQRGDYLITYESLLYLENASHAELVLAQLSQFLVSHDYQMPTNESWEKAIKSQLKPSFNRSEKALLPPDSYSQVSKFLIELCENIYKEINSSNDRILSMTQQFDNIPRLVLVALNRDGLTHSLHQNHVHESNQVLVDELEETRRSLVFLEDKLKNIQASNSWKLTSPIRKLKDFLS